MTFDQLDIKGPSRLRFRLRKLAKNKIFVANLIGDGKGEIGALKNQTLMIEVTEAKERLITLTANVFVDFAASLVLATNLTIDGSSLTINGLLANVRTLIVESKSSIFFGPQSQTGILQGESYVSLSDRGAQQFGQVVLKSNSNYGGNGPLKLNVGKLSVRTGVMLHRRSVNLQVNWIKMERGSVISTNGLGAMGTVSKGAGLLGGGGGHASSGGGHKGGTSYGSFIKPQEAGSPGGNSTNERAGGEGGGIVTVIANTFLFDGSIECSGSGAALTTKAGGGSGGSIHLDVSRLFSGGGNLLSNGGNGDEAGGGGAGGRIAVHVKTESKFHGKIEAFGGRSENVASLGGPGTVYLTDIRDKKEYRILKISNRDTLDNKFVVLNDSKSEYSFDELHLFKSAALSMGKENHAAVLRLANVFGDNSGLIHIHASQYLYFKHNLYRKTVARVNFNLKVDHGGSAFLADKTFFQGIGSIALEVNGTLIGIQDIIIAEKRLVKIHQSANTKRFINGKYVSSPDGSYHFATIQMFTGSDVRLEGGVGVEFVTNYLSMKYSSKMSAKFFKLITSSVDIESGAEINCAGTVPDKRPDILSSQGAGHGSYGGNGYSSFAAPYGSYIWPQNTGSMGGNGALLGGFGGGFVRIEAGVAVIIDGTITADGQNAPVGGSGGGGSGGSIFIKAYEVKGTGGLSVKGGTGDSSGGGGAAGRIAIHVLTRNEFSGDYHAAGGVSRRSNSFGGPGTVYISQVKYKQFHSQLIVDNSKRLSVHPVILDEFNTTEYVFNEILIFGGAKLQIRPGPGVLIIHSVKGDRTGILWSVSNQTFYIEKEQYSTSAPVNFVVGETSKLVLPSVVRLLGEFGSISPGPQASLVLRGLLDGVRDMVVSKSKRFYFIGKAHTSFTENGTYIVEEPQTFRFPLFELQDGSKFQLINVTSMKCTIGNFHLKYGVTLVADIIDISATNLKLEDGSRITAAGTDRPGLVAEPALPRGCMGAGGSHASIGGLGLTSSQFSPPLGSMYRPTLFGTRGCPGNGDGGLGGGSVKFFVTNKLYVNGIITADGASSLSGSNSGGGAGGSVLIDAETLEGHGSVNVNGGNGEGVKGGGGSGGRVAVNLKKQIQYLGTFTGYGGKAGDITKDKTDKGGGPGTIFIADVRKGYDYNQLRIDNQNRGWGHYVTLDENITSYEFSEVHLHRSASLQMNKDYIQRNLTVQKIIGDRTGLVHVHKNQLLRCEVKDARVTTSRTLANFKLDAGSEAIMPTVLHIVGLGAVAFDWNGRLTNNLYFHIAHKRKVLIGAMSHTSLIVNKERKYIDRFGTFRFSHLEFGSGSVIVFPPPMGVTFTAGLLVSFVHLHLIFQFFSFEPFN